MKSIVEHSAPSKTKQSYYAVTSMRGLCTVF